MAVIGIGNSLASDDGVGIEIVRELGRELRDERVAFMECERGGLDLLDMLTGFDLAMIVDAAKTGVHPPGHVAVVSLCRPYASSGFRSLHTIDLHSTMAFGATMGMQLPDEVRVIAVEAADTETFREECTAEVRSAIPHIVKGLKEEIRHYLKSNDVPVPGGPWAEGRLTNEQHDGLL
jgi:hydrogenase maturation protease